MAVDIDAVLTELNHKLFLAETDATPENVVRYIGFIHGVMTSHEVGDNVYFDDSLRCWAQKE